MVSSKPLYCIEHPSATAESPDPFYLRSLKRPACILHVTRNVSSLSCRPPTPQTHHHEPSASRVALPPGKDSLGKRSHQQPESDGEIECRSFESSQKSRGKKACPFKEKEGGKEWAAPESSGGCPKPLGAYDRSLFSPFTREIGFLCLILNCK